MLSPTRRTFLKTATVGLAAVPYTFAQSASLSNTQLADNIYLLKGAGCNLSLSRTEASTAS